MSKKNKVAAIAVLAMSELLISAIKRNDRKAVLAETLEMIGKPAEAQEVRDASRITTALIDRTCVLGVSEPEVETPEVPEEVMAKEAVKDAAELTYEDAPKDDPKSYPEVRKALKKGKHKKALKLIKTLEEGGTRGSVLKGLKKEAKAGK